MTLSMQRMVARITGIIKGNNTSGNSNSRARARNVIAAVIVPKTQKPMVPSKVTRKSCGSKFQADKLNKIQNSGMTTSSTSRHQDQIKTRFWRRTARRGRAAKAARRQDNGCLVRLETVAPSPRVPVNKNANQSSAGAISAILSGGKSKAK